MTTNSLVFLALLPGLIIIFYIYKKDTVEKEPWSLILKLMAFGALSCIPASFMETMIDGAMPYYPEGSLPYALSMAFLSAAFCEELCKFAFLRFGAWKSREFGYRFDGIVYGVAVALGFALLENVLYVIEGGFEVALMRGVMAVPLHSFCGVFMGIYFGAAKQAQIQGRSTGKYFLLALLIPMLIHGIYDTLAFLGSNTAAMVLLGFVVLMYIISVHYVRQYSRDDWSTGFYPGADEVLSSGAGRQAASGGFSSAAGRQAASGGFSSAAGRQAASGGFSSGAGRQAAGSYRPYPGQVHQGKLILSCPHCKGGLRVPAGMGAIRVKCPHCGREFEAHS